MAALKTKGLGVRPSSGATVAPYSGPQLTRLRQAPVCLASVPLACAPRYGSGQDQLWAGPLQGPAGRDGQHLPRRPHHGRAPPVPGWGPVWSRRREDSRASSTARGISAPWFTAPPRAQGFSRGSSSFRGVTAHPSGRWESRIGIPGSKHVYLGARPPTCQGALGVLLSPQATPPLRVRGFRRAV